MPGFGAHYVASYVLPNINAFWFRQDHNMQGVCVCLCVKHKCIMNVFVMQWEKYLREYYDCNYNSNDC